MTKRFKASITEMIKAKRSRIGKMIRKICGRKIVNGRYRIAEGMRLG